MSSSTKNPATDTPSKRRRYADFDEYVEYQLQKTRATIRSQDILTAGLGVSALVLGYLLVFVILDQWVVPGGLSFWPRVVLLSAVVLACGWWIVRGIILPALRRVTELFAARAIEDQVPSLRNMLLSMVDLRRAGRPVSP
ncbi:MAG TPA: hypothetical protein EYP14_20485, partial [Planctomycetaceae bacterium]|nr:hypothetical protein [Planctomycetaceae bacterium]